MVRIESNEGIEGCDRAHSEREYWITAMDAVLDFRCRSCSHHCCSASSAGMVDEGSLKKKGTPFRSAPSQGRIATRRGFILNGGNLARHAAIEARRLEAPRQAGIRRLLSQGFDQASSSGICERYRPSSFWLYLERSDPCQPQFDPTHLRT
jgi:hypothetical protein